MRRLRRFFELSPVRRRLLLETTLLLVTSRTVLAVGSIHTTGRVLDRIVPVLDRLLDGPTTALADLTWALETADRLVPGTGTCLQVALVGDHLLATHGYDATLRIGVATDERGQFEAHAWLERDERVVVGDLPDISRFRPLPVETADRLTDLS